MSTPIAITLTLSRLNTSDLKKMNSDSNDANFMLSTTLAAQ